MNRIEIIPPFYLRLKLVAFAASISFVPVLVTVAFIKILLSPGNPPFYLYVIGAIWCVVVVPALVAIIKHTLARLQTSVRITWDLSLGTLHAAGETFDVDSYRISADGMPASIWIHANGKKYFITGEWTGFQALIKHLTSMGDEESQ